MGPASVDKIGGKSPFSPCLDEGPRDEVVLFVFKTHSCFVACTDLKLKSSLPPQTPTVEITDVCYIPGLLVFTDSPNYGFEHPVEVQLSISSHASFALSLDREE